MANQTRRMITVREYNENKILKASRKKAMSEFRVIYVHEGKDYYVHSILIYGGGWIVDIKTHATHERDFNKLDLDAKIYILDED